MSPTRILRAVVALSVMLAAWTLARPAAASAAPFCDDRGASAIAPPPVLEASGEAISRTHLAQCDGRRVSPFATVTRSRAPVESSGATVDPALPAHVPVLARVVGRLTAFAVLFEAPASGVRSRVDRPPR